MVMTDTTVRKSVTVSTPRERAFAVFTERLDSWWPRSHHTGAADMKAVVLEPRQGGRWYEIGVAARASGAGSWSGSRPIGSCWPGSSTPPGISTPSF
jgi:hypothetical protein